MTSTYAEAIREIASELEHHNVVLIDLWRAVMLKAGQSSRQGPDFVDNGTSLTQNETGVDGAMRALLEDGLHLTGEGYQVFARELLPKVGQHWDMQTASDWVFPPWNAAPKTMG